MMYGVYLNPNRIRRMTTIEITGMVRKTVTTGRKNVASPGLNPDQTPKINPNTNAIVSAKINRRKLDNIAINEADVTNNL